MFYRIRLEVFEGPFDLLLFLINKDEIDIYDIPIVEITEQFLVYVESGDRINLEHAGEFIEMVSILMKIKVSMLLPQRKDEKVEIDDPRTDLVKKLIEYKRYKEASKELEDMERRFSDISSRQYFQYLKDLSNQAMDQEVEYLEDISLYDLIKAYKRVVDSIPKITEHHVERIQVTIEEQSDYLRKSLQEKRTIMFSEIFAKFTEKIIHVVTFIAMLEMTKLREIELKQNDNFTDIEINLIEEEVGA
jgi:segregation and condensation protein A